MVASKWFIDFFSRLDLRMYSYTKRISVVIEWESEDMEYNEDYDAGCRIFSTVYL